MLHNQTAYLEPFSFKPEYFLNASRDFHDDPLLTLAFSFSYQLCPTQYFVDSSLFIAFSYILSMFYISLPKDNQIRQRTRHKGAFHRQATQNGRLLDPAKDIHRYAAGYVDCLRGDL
jgi:hypothetical protein